MNNDIVPFATTNFRNHSRVFGVKAADRRNHMYVIGKTGVGKTTLLKNMMISDVVAGRGVAVVDPHGEFAESILDYVPENRIDDVVYFNPADLDFPIAFNAVEKVGIKERHLVSSGLIAIFKKIWADSWGRAWNTFCAMPFWPCLSRKTARFLASCAYCRTKNTAKRSLST